MKKTSSALCLFVAGMILLSGFSALSVATSRESDQPVTLAAVENPAPKNTVQRVVLLEDFTSWECPPCATLNPLMSPAVDALGYTKVAPALYHVWWPNYDDDPVYQWDKQEVTNRVNYYGCNYVPWYMLDGSLVATPTSSAAVTAGINARSAVPANMTIATQGFISGTGGKIDIKVTAVENIAKTDLRVFVNLWENNITRPLWNYRLAAWDSPPYPNGEMELDWAVWDYVPTEAGTAIWPSGASIGNSVELSFPLYIDSTWNPAEMGVTVFVQSVGTRNVEQAAVETFHNYPPTVTMSSPAPATANQILSGTIPIIWAANDTEDAAGTIDMSIDYSADGGVTWTNIMTGTNNNIAPFTYNWNTVSAGIPDGPGYKIRVKGVDSHGDYTYFRSTEAFSIDNTLNDKWYFQVEKAGSNMDLDMKPVEINPNLAVTNAIPTSGDYYVGKWQTTQTFTSKNINGAWTFNVYGKTPNPGLTQLTATLYAKVFTSSNTVTPLDTTVVDNENVGLFLTTHMFTWTDTLAGTITNGDSLIVEVWLSVTGGPYTQNSGVITNTGFDSAATPWTYYDWDDAGPGTVTGSYVATNGNPGGFVQIAAVSESTGAGDTAYPYVGYYQQSFTTTFAPFRAQLSLDWKVVAANAVDPLTMTFSVYVETATGIPTTTPVWKQESTASAPTAWASITPIDLSSIVNAATTYYVKIAFKHDSLQKGDGTYTGGYDNVVLTWNRTYSVFFMEYDYGTTQSNLAPYIGTGVPVSVTANIPVVAGWNLVSIPIIATDTRLPYALTDTVNAGAGLVQWDRAMWYNPATPADVWKQFNKNWNAVLNDLKNAPNTAGVWLYVTTVGDGIITVGGTNYTTPATTGITLKLGWNLVGFPSDDTTYTVATLKGAYTSVTMVEQFDGAQTYKTIAMADATAFAQGKAYWVYSNADTTWNKAW